MAFLINLLLFLVPLILFGLIIGRTVERRHFRDLDRRELQHQSVLVTQLRSFPNAEPGGPAPMIVMSEVVIASDYLKSWLAGWRKLFGGEMKSFRTLQERAKREAVLRLTERAVAQGFNAVCNVRISGADIGGSTANRKVPMAAVIATGTAYRAGSTST